MPTGFMNKGNLKIGRGALWKVLFVGVNGFTRCLDDEDCGLLGGLAVYRAGECEA